VNNTSAAKARRFETRAGSSPSSPPRYLASRPSAGLFGPTSIRSGISDLLLCRDGAALAPQPIPSQTQLANAGHAKRQSCADPTISLTTAGGATRGATLRAIRSAINAATPKIVMVNPIGTAVRPAAPTSGAAAAPMAN